MNNRRNLKENLTISNKQRFSIRKFSIGVASVMLGTTLYFMGGVGPSIVHADSVDQPVQTQTSKDINSAQASSDATLAQQDSDQNQSQVSSVQNDEKTTNDQTAVKSSQQATNASAVKSNTQDSKKSVSDTNETKSVANKAQTSDQLATATSDKSSQQVAKTGTKNSNTLDIKQNKQRLAGNVKLNALTDNKAQTDTQTNSKYSVTDNYPADLTNYLPSTFNNKQEYAFEWLRTETGKNIILTTNRTGDGVVYVYQDRKKVGKLAQNKSLDLDFGADVDYGANVDYGEYTGTVYNDTMSGFVQSNPVKVDESPFSPDYHYNKLTVIYSSHAKDVKKGSFYTGISFFVPHKITQTVTYKNSNDQVIDRLTHTQDGLTGQSYTTGLPSGPKYVRRGEYLDNITNNGSGLMSEFYDGYSCTKDYHDGVSVTFTEKDSEKTGTGTMDYVIYDGGWVAQWGSLAYGQSTNYTNDSGRYTIVNPYVPQTTNIVYQYKELGYVVNKDPKGTTTTQYKNDPDDPTTIEPINVPSIPGYTTMVNGETVSDKTKPFWPADLSKNTYITYSANKQAARVIYVDKTTNDVLTSDDLSGTSDKDSGYNTKDTIGKYQSQHYVLTGDETDGKNVIFDHDDKQDQTYYVYFVHGTHTINQTTSPKQTIHYVYADGLARQGQAADNNVQQLSFKRDGYNDEVTGIDHWNAWTPANSNYKAVDSPVIQGYTPDKSVIEKSTVNPTDKDTEITVVYNADKQAAHVIYVDKTTNTTLDSKDLSGKSDKDSEYNTKDTIGKYQSQHYVLDEDETKGKNVIFDHNDKQDQTYYVYFVHGTHAIKQTTSPKQTIHYVYADGLARQGKAADDNVQQLSFKRDGYNDEVTGTDHWNAWTPANSQYEAVDSPVIQGYTPDKLVVEKSTVNPTDKDIEITVTYNADKQTAHVIYFDKTANTTLDSKDLSGKSDKDSEYNTEDKIGEYKSQHYVLDEDETKGKNVIFDHNDKQDQTYYVYFVHDTKNVSHKDDVNMTVHYVMDDGSEAPSDNKRTLSFTENGIQDLVTKSITWTPADSQTFKDVVTPNIAGYTPDQDKAAGQTVKFGDKDVEVTVTYHNNAQKASVTYVDDKTGKTLKVDNLNGVTNAKSGYTTKAAIDTYTGLGYTLVSDDTNGNEVVFDNDDANDQAFTVHLSHGTITVTPENPGKPGEPINPGEGSANYPDGTDKTGLTDTVNRAITYVMIDGSKAPDAVHDSLSYTASKVIDKVNGEVLETKWSANQDFKDVDSPSVKGYTPDKKTVSNKNLAHDAADITETVKYSADAQKASVTYVDDKTGKTLKVDNLNGVTSAKSGYTTKAAIDTYTGLGYTVVSDDTNGKEVVFDNDDAVDQAFTVHLSHGTTTVTPDNPGHPGEPVDPDNPDGPKYPDGTEEYQVKRIGTQIIHYVGASDKTPADNKQTFIFTREITFDNVTGKIISKTPWNVQSHTFGNVDTPVIPGYHADKAVAGGATVTPDDLNKVITVTYAPDGGSGDNPGSNGGGDQGTTPSPDDQPDTTLPSDNNTDKDVEKDKQDKPEKVKKARKIIKTRITKQEHIGNAEKAEPLAEQEHNDQTVASPVKNEANEPQLPQTGEANTSAIGLLGMLVAGFAAILGFESSRSRKHKN